MSVGEIRDSLIRNVKRIVLRNFGLRLRVDDVEDIVNESLRRACDNFTQFDSARGSLKSWLTGIARNVAREMNKRRWVRQRSREIGAPNYLAIATAESSASRLAINSLVISEFDSVELHEAIGRLKERQRLVITASFGIDGPSLSDAEIAERLAVTRSTVRSLRQRALAALRADQRLALAVVRIDERLSNRARMAGGGGAINAYFLEFPVIAATARPI